MVQLNPAKWGREKRQKNRRILEIKDKLRDTKFQGRSGSKVRSNLKNELSSLGGKTYRQEDRDDRKARKQYDREHKIVNRRGRTTGYKEGYDPSKGIKGHKATNTKSTKSSKSTSKSKATMTGAERAKAMAKANIKKHGGTASAAAANKEAMRKKIKERYQAKKNKKK